ncbi:MAG: RHS repeat-associated core domain-containing protein, partial [Thermoguttaceae bacterium]
KTVSPTTDPDKPVAVSQTVYDEAGNPWKQVDPYGYVTENLYGMFGEIVKTIRTADDHRGNVQKLTTQFEYDRVGRLIETTDPAGRTTEFKYDSLGRRTETIDALGLSQKTEYDKKGRVIAETDAAENRTEHSYNLRGQRVSTKLPPPSEGAESPVHRQFYNVAGQLKGSVSPSGRVTSYLYDEFGRSASAYLGILLEKPSQVGEEKSVYTFEHLFPNESYCIFATWKSNPTSNEAVSIRVFDVLRGDAAEVHAGNIRASANPQHDFWMVPFSSAPFQRLGDTIEPKGNTLSVELGGNLNDFNVYIVRIKPMSRTEYNDKGQVLSRTDARGNSVFYTYDAFGQQISATRDGDENSCCSEGKTFYNANGQAFASLAPDGRLTMNGYDTLGRQDKSYLGYLTEVKTGQYTLAGLPLGEEFDLYVSGQTGNKVDSLKLGDITLVKQKTFTVSTTSLNGTLTGQGHVAIIRKLPMRETKFDFAGRVVASLDAKRNETQMFYDSLGRQIAVIQPAADGTQTRLATHRYFDEAGNAVAQVVVPVDLASLKEAGEKRVTRMEYDKLGRLIAVTQPSPSEGVAGPVTRHEYDTLGNLVKTIDPLGHETRFAYDNLRRKIGEKNAEGGVTRFRYDSEGRMLSLTDPVDNTTSWIFGMNGRIAAEHITIDGVQHNRQFFYDASNNIVSKTDRNGRITAYTFDKLNRHTSEIWYDDYAALQEKKPSKVFKTTYNRAGKMATMDDGDNKFEFTYGVFGNEINQKQTLAGLEKPLEFEYATDISGLRTQYSAKVDGKVDHANGYAFDNLGRMTSISQTGEGFADKSAMLVYDSFGQLASQTRFEAETLVAETCNTFDGLGRIVNISHTKDATVFADYDLSWDAGNRITDFDFTYLNGSPKKKSRYSYDRTSQLIGAKYDFMANEAYAFDANGNRKTADIQGLTEDYETGAFNRLLSDSANRFAFDAEGNRVSKTSGDETTRYHWDNRNRLVKIETPQETIEYVYDYKNRLVKRTTSKNCTTFVHDGWQIVLQFDGSSKAVLSHRYLWGAKQDELLADNENWALGDHLNTVRDVVRADGTGVTHLEYNAFGKLLTESVASLGFAYTGKLTDAKTGLQWNVNRWYDASVGKWVSDDPLGFDAKDANINRYVKNMPLGYVDYLGYASNPASKFSCCKEFDVMYNNVPGMTIGLTDWEKGEECRKYLLDDVWWNNTIALQVSAIVEAALVAGSTSNTVISIPLIINTPMGTSIVMTTITTTVGAASGALAAGGAIGAALGVVFSYADATLICNSYFCKVSGGSPTCSCSPGGFWGVNWLCRCPFGQEIYQHSDTGRYQIYPGYGTNHTTVGQHW